MSIINLKKTFENEQLVYCNIDNKIIECICLSKLSKYNRDYDNEYLGTFICNKVKIITIYDIYKNIIYEPNQTNIFKDSIKIGENLERTNIYFFKTFTGAFIKNNKLNYIQYYTNYKGFVYKFLYDNVSLSTIGYIKTFNINDNEGKCIHKFKYKKDLIIYKNHNNLFNYTIYNNHIKITKEEFPFHQTIYCYKKNLKIFQIEKYYENIKKIHESRNHNNEITYLMEYDDDTYKIKKIFISNNTNPPFSKPLRKYCIELINYYKKNINNYTELIKSCFKKEKIIHNNLLLNCKLEIINSK